ncbi:hypothetical protein KI655_12860 [Vibrio sp. D404a]|uniref:hypothetical protein n=1 Tax=unclassified Vibrio TaxID=2614977 RepID=UPI0025527888|nr:MULTISPECIES: hypothetical protein [unclassified Vibrio]MDK9738188.1 hypothetical protein [Vibrio sp. D404a]MDK9796479.1 hypothetical protein [Vibrio sp. D449a]
MKYIIIALFALAPAMTFASSLATPYVPCYVNGDYVGNMEIPICKKDNGYFYLE